MRLFYKQKNQSSCNPIDVL